MAYVNTPAGMTDSTIKAARDSTDLETLDRDLQNSDNRLRDMLAALERRLDRLLSAPTSQGLNPVAAPEPPREAGTIQSLRDLAGILSVRCDQLDAQLARLFGVI